MDFYHALAIDEQHCRGCTHCTSVCPMSGVRIRGGRAAIMPAWCVDCGECLKACRAKGTNSIFVEQDDFQHIFDYDNRVVLVPAIFLAQFPETTREDEIFGALRRLGFTHIYQVEMSVELVHEAMAEAIRTAECKPAISPFCPAIVRLIQAKYPDLTEHIINVRTPVEVTAMMLRRQFEKEGLARERTGLFYITPCAAKISVLKGLLGGEQLIDGTLNMDSLYNRVQTLLKNSPRGELAQEGAVSMTLTECEMSWSQTGGEADTFAGRSFAVDDIHNVIEFLDRMELSEEGMKNIDFLELRACDRGCMGGVLTPTNRFLAAESLHKRAETHPAATQLYDNIDTDIIDATRADMHFEAVRPMPKLIHSGGRVEVLKKMHSVEQILTLLPMIDCGACGSPDCRSLAEDIVRGDAQLTNCIFMQRELEKRGEMDSTTSLQLLEEVWGNTRFDRRRKKTE